MNSKEEESSGIFSVYCPVGLMGQTWFISCLFFMKLNMYDLLVTLLELFTLRSRMNGLVIRENILQIQRNFVFRLLL